MRAFHRSSLQPLGHTQNGVGHCPVSGSRRGVQRALQILSGENRPIAPRRCATRRASSTVGSGVQTAATRARTSAEARRPEALEDQSSLSSDRYRGEGHHPRVRAIRLRRRLASLPGTPAPGRPGTAGDVIGVMGAMSLRGRGEGKAPYLLTLITSTHSTTHTSPIHRNHRLSRPNGIGSSCDDPVVSPTSTSTGRA
jgi:hypothetical protein